MRHTLRTLTFAQMLLLAIIASSCNVAKESSLPSSNNDTQSELEDTSNSSEQSKPSYRFVKPGQSNYEGVNFQPIYLQRGSYKRSEPASVFLEISGTADSSDILAYYQSGKEIFPESGFLEIEFEAGQAIAELKILGGSDNIYEPNETLVLSIVQSSEGIYDVKQNAQHIVTIVNDEPTPEIRFSQTSSTVVEGNVKSIPLELSGESSMDSKVILGIFSASATAADHDFSSQVFTIPAGQTSASLDITAINDAFNELDETLAISISASTGTSEPSSNNIHTLTITESLATPSFEFAQASASVAEGGSLSIQVDFTGSFDQDITLPYTISGLYKNGTDYTIDSNYITLPMGSSSANIELQTKDDDIYEENEIITFTLQDQSFGIASGQTTTSVTIVDNDSVPQAQFATTTYYSREDSVFYLPVRLSNPAEDEIVVTYTVDGSSTLSAGSDYLIAGSSGGSGSIRIPAGKDFANIPIRFFEDSVFEGEETLNLSLGSASFTNYAATPSVGASNQTSIVVRETQDLPQLNFTLLEQDAYEGDASVSISVELDQASDIDLDFSISLSSASASEGDDFTMPVMDHTIPAGSSTYTFSMSLADDATDEPDETISFSLVQPPSMELGDKKTQQIRIIDDDDKSVASISANGNVTEGGQQSFIISLDKASDFDIEIPIAFSSTSAVLDVDFTASAKTATIAAGSTNAMIVIEAIDDGFYEGAANEEIQAFILPGNYYDIATANDVMEISDAQSLPSVYWSYVNPILSAAESSLISLEIELSSPTYKDVVVDVTIDDNYPTNCNGVCANILSPASSGRYDTDLNTISEMGVVQVVIPAGEKKRALSFKILTDDESESLEMFKLTLSGVDDGAASQINLADDEIELSITDQN